MIGNILRKIKGTKFNVKTHNPFTEPSLTNNEYLQYQRDIVGLKVITDKLLLTVTLTDPLVLQSSNYLNIISYY